MLNCISILIFNGIYIEGKLKYKNIEKAPFDLYFARVALYPTFFPKDNLHLNVLFYGRHILLNLIHVDPCFRPAFFEISIYKPADPIFLKIQIKIKGPELAINFIFSSDPKFSFW